MIHIVDPQTNEILDYITLDNIIDDTHKKSLESYLETYDAIVLGGNNFSYDKHLEKRNHIIIPDEDGTYQEFILFEVEKYRDTEGRKTHFYAHATYLELKKAKVIYPTRREGFTLSQHAGWALNNTGWRVGIVESEGVRTFNIENHTNPYEFLKRLANEFEVEIRFRVEHDGRRITARYVDFLERIGDWKGREVEFGRDLDSIRRIEKQDIVTALLGLGPERDDGTRLEVLVEDEEALQRWGRIDENGNLKHLIEPYEIQSDRQEMTEEEARRYTRTALDKRINTQVTYETTILDLEEVPGLEHEKIRFGDTIRIKDTYFNPPLYLEARVFEIERSIKNKAKKDIKLGDYVEYTEEEVHAIWRQLRNQIRRRITAAQLVEYAEPKKVESNTPPPINSEGDNPIWVDTSQEPYIPYVADVENNEWVRMTLSDDDVLVNEVNYNGLKWSKDEGLIVERSDGKVRSILNGTDGIKVQQKIGSEWVDVYYVDENGNVKFAGHLEGASGIFGEVTAVDGDFYYEDTISQMKYGVKPKTNLIKDHSFEQVELFLGTYDRNYHWADMVDGAYPLDAWLIGEGSPKVGVYLTTPGLSRIRNRIVAPFDYKSIIVNSTNTVYQIINDLLPSRTYTFSVYCKKPYGRNGGTPRIRVYRGGDASGPGLLLSTYTHHSQVPSNDELIRIAYTFTTPSDLDDVENISIELLSADNLYVLYDGAQLVEGDIPAVYNPDSTLWDMVAGYHYIRRINADEVSGSTVSADRLAVNEFSNPLWTGALYPLSTHTIIPLKSITLCTTGWILRWQAFDRNNGTVVNSDFHYTHIPKIHVINNNGAGVRLVLSRGGVGTIGKYVYVYNDRIVGYDSNNQDNNHNLVLTGVFEY